MKRITITFLLTLVTTLVILGIAACGAAHHSVTPVHPVRPSVTVTGTVHPCKAKDAAMQCFLPPSRVGAVALRQGSSIAAYGIDFGWSCPVSQARNFGASYLSYDISKNWTRSCINLFHSQHKGTIAVWEAGANDAQGSWRLGHDQANLARQLLNALGAGADQPILMAIDCDCAGSSLVSYFQGANAAQPHRIDAYGGYYQIQYLYSKHLVGHVNWQTYAWSGGRWLPANVAPLEQYLNSSQVDYDRAIAPYYGQWPFKSVKPQPTYPRCFGKNWEHTAKCNKVRQQAVVLGQRRTRQSQYLATSNHNLATVQSQIVALQKQLAAKQARQTVIERNKGNETSKFNLFDKELKTLLHNYHYHT